MLDATWCHKILSNNRIEMNNIDIYAVQNEYTMNRMIHNANLFLHFCAMPIYILLEFGSQLRTCQGAVAAADGECPCCLPSGLAFGLGAASPAAESLCACGPPHRDGWRLAKCWKVCWAKNVKSEKCFFFKEMSGEIWRALILTVVAEGNMPRGRRCRKMLGPQMRNDEEWKEWGLRPKTSSDPNQPQVQGSLAMFSISCSAHSEDIWRYLRSRFAQGISCIVTAWPSMIPPENVKIWSCHCQCSGWKKNTEQISAVCWILGVPDFMNHNWPYFLVNVNPGLINR